MRISETRDLLSTVDVHMITLYLGNTYKRPSQARQNIDEVIVDCKYGVSTDVGQRALLILEWA